MIIHPKYLFRNFSFASYQPFVGSGAGNFCRSGISPNDNSS